MLLYSYSYLHRSISLYLSIYIYTHSYRIFSLQRREHIYWTSQWKCSSHWEFRLLFWNNGFKRYEEWRQIEIPISIWFGHNANSAQKCSLAFDSTKWFSEFSSVGAHQTLTLSFVAATSHLVSSTNLLVMRSQRWYAHCTEPYILRVSSLLFFFGKSSVVFRTNPPVWYSFPFGGTIHFNISRISDLCKHEPNSLSPCAPDYIK